MKKLLLLLISFLLVGCSASNVTSENTIIVEKQGHNGKIQVAVSFQNNQIRQVEILNHHESPGVSDPALIDLPKEIVEYQSVALDVKSGVSVSSKAVLEAVSEAILQAGYALDDFQQPIEYAENPKEIIEIEKDVVIIGSGGAGISAAATIHELNGSVVIVEKMPYYGGNTLRAGGTMNAVDPIRQKRQGIEDSIELYIQQTYDFGGQKGDLKLIQTLAENALDARNWLSSYGGKWSEYVYQTIGGLWPRSMDVNVYGDTLNMYLDPLLKAVLSDEENDLLLNVKATAILMDEGVVKGIEAESTIDGTKYRIYGKKGVLIATGGYSANLEMVRLFNSNIPLNTSNHIGATGDGIILAQQVNAALVGMDAIQIHPHGNPQSGLLQSEIAGNVTDSIYINVDGKRFVNEQATWQEISEAVLNQPNKIMYSIYDAAQNIQDKMQAISEFRLIEADSIGSLATKLGIDETSLKNTIQTYNTAILQGSEDAFGKNLGHPIEQAPFYACLLTPVYHYTMGGIQINEQAQVISIDHQVIPHLYAAGEVTGGIHGDNRLGGNAMTDNTVFGRIAGQNLMNES